MSSFGTITNVASAETAFVESAQADDLQDRVNAVLDAVYAADPARAVTAITLAGAGDGHTFTVAIDHAPVTDVAGGLADPSTAQVICYLASENEALSIARNSIQFPEGSVIADEQLAGGAKGTRFMGLVVHVPQQTPPVPVLSRVGGFFALMPGDNSATVAVGAAVQFPQDGPASAGITRVSASQFNLATPGVYRVFWQVSVTEAGQLMLDLDDGGGADLLAETVAGRATGTSQIMNEVLITTTVANSVLRVINPPGNAAALTITPDAGGTHAVSAWLTIELLS